jgi:putative SOS response-associated peptidase YedK
MFCRYGRGRHRAASVFERHYFARLEEYRGRYNAAPTQMMPIARLAQGQPELIEARWGLIPHWAKDAKIGYSTINARGETVAVKPAFRSAYKARRCLVPVFSAVL